MEFTLVFSVKANKALEAAQRDVKRYRKVVRCLTRIEQNPMHPGLNSHPYEVTKGPNGEKIWESYVENNTPSAWRVWWHYGPEAGEITVYDMGPHP